MSTWHALGDSYIDRPESARGRARSRASQFRKSDCTPLLQSHRGASRNRIVLHCALVTRISPSSCTGDVDSSIDALGMSELEEGISGRVPDLTIWSTIESEITKLRDDTDNNQ